MRSDAATAARHAVKPSSQPKSAAPLSAAAASTTRRLLTAAEPHAAKPSAFAASQPKSAAAVSAPASSTTRRLLTAAEPPAAKPAAAAQSDAHANGDGNLHGWGCRPGRSPANLHCRCNLLRLRNCLHVSELSKLAVSRGLLLHPAFAILGSAGLGPPRGAGSLAAASVAAAVECAAVRVSTVWVLHGPRHMLFRMGVQLNGDGEPMLPAAVAAAAAVAVAAAG